jgi:hypothetical protein
MSEKFNVNPVPEIALSPTEKQILQDLYRDDIKRIEEIIGRDLSAWL